MVKNKKATMYSKDDGDKCFQYAVTVVLNHGQIKKDSQRISKINPFSDH